MTSLLFSNKDSIDAYTQIVSNPTKVLQYKKRQEWMRNESIDIMSQSNQSEIVSSSPCIDLGDINDDNHHNQSESSTNDSIYVGGTTPVTCIENFINTFEMQPTTNIKQNSTSLNSKEIGPSQILHCNQTHPHLRINNHQLIGKKKNNEIHCSHKQRIHNLKEQKNSNNIYNCDRMNSSPQCYMTQVRDIIITQQQKLNDETSSNEFDSSTQDYEHENIKNSQNHVPCFKSQHKELMQTTQRSNTYPFLNPRSKYVYKENTCIFGKPSHTNPMMPPSMHIAHTSKFRNSFNNLLNKVPLTNSKHETKLDDDSLAKNERKVTFSVQNVHYVRASTQSNPIDRNNTPFDPVEGSHNQNNWTNHDPNYIENNYTPEDSYTPENEYALDNEFNPEMGNDLKNNRMEVGTYCEPSAMHQYQEQFPREIMEENPSNYYVPTLQDDRDLQSFDNNRPEDLYTNYQHFDEPSTSNSNFQHPCNENENNGFREDSVNSENDQCVFDEPEDYNGSEHFEENEYDEQSYDESNGGNFEDNPRYKNSTDFGHGNNETQDESVSCSDRSFEPDQMGNSSRRSYATFIDTSQKPVNTLLGSARGSVEVEEEEFEHEEPLLELESLDPHVELRRSSQVVQELEKMKLECGESIEVQKEIEKMVQGGRGISVALRKEIEKQSQIEIKESLQEELEDELQLGLEECLNPDMQGMEELILQLFAKAEAEMESLEIRVKAERNRGDITPKPPAEMEGYKKRKEEREKVRKENRKKLMGTLSSVVDGNPRQPTTSSTCNFCNSEAAERPDVGRDPLKLAVVTDEEIRLLIQQNEVESENLAQRIHHTLNANPIVVSSELPALDAASTV